LPITTRLCPPAAATLAVHGFDEFFGYLYHLDAMEDPYHKAIWEIK
jgi:hypothetical protein